MLKNIKNAACVTAILIGGAFSTSQANAHSTSIGYENGGAVGSVIVWLGTYQHGGHHLEGSMNLTGANGNPYPATTVAFTLAAGAGGAGWTGLAGYQGLAKPAGLIDGVTNFYSPDSNVGGGAPLSASEAGFLAGCPACGPTNHWQGAVFNGLAAGDYQFTWTPIANPSQEWSLLNTNMNGIFTLQGTVITGPSGVPIPAIFPIFAAVIGLFGWFGWRRRRKAAAEAVA